MSITPVVSMRGIRKSFGPVEVLCGVDFDVLPGEVHVVAGENGAGKSTLIKILSGVYADFAGDLHVRGRPQRFSHPKDASAAGIATIHQELSLVPSMSVADNLFLGREITGGLGQVNAGAQVAEAARILEEMKLECSPNQLVAELPISSQQLLEIGRALARDAALLIFDEPTSALNERETEFLFSASSTCEGRAVGSSTLRTAWRRSTVWPTASPCSAMGGSSARRRCVISHQPISCAGW